MLALQRRRQETIQAGKKIVTPRRFGRGLQLGICRAQGLDEVGRNDRFRLGVIEKTAKSRVEKALDQGDPPSALIERCVDEIVVAADEASHLQQGIGPELRPALAYLVHSVTEGFGELMRSVSLQYVPTAILSRQTAGIRNQSLIVNLPGKPSAIADCLDAVFPAIPYCIDLIDGPYIRTKEHVVEAFRPKKRPASQR